jgi:hypothetical protein
MSVKAYQYRVYGLAFACMCATVASPCMAQVKAPFLDLVAAKDVVLAAGVKPPIAELTPDSSAQKVLPQAEATDKSLQKSPVAASGVSAANPEDDSQELSYGSWKYSVMFSPEDNERIKKVLRSFELGLDDAQVKTDDKKDSLDDTVNALMQDAEKAGVVKTVRMPSFHLHSIMYTSAHQWSLWLNTDLIANDTPDTMQGVEAVSVSSDRVVFKWTLPADAVAAVKAKKKSKKTAKSKNKVEEVPAVASNRLAQSAAALRYDEKENAYYFTLKANQVFVSDSERIYEGTPQGVDLVPLEQMYSAKAEVAAKTAEKLSDNDTADTSKKTTSSNPANKDAEIVKMLEEKVSPKAQIIKALGGEVPVKSAVPEELSK